jgi:Bifunctional DNA primase/polymerase, N-terminal
VQGLPVFPCSRNKTPCISKAEGGHGYLDASRDRAEIKQLFAHPHAALVGVPTGMVSGLDVLDLDYRHGAGAWEQAHSQSMPATRTHQTLHGGRHYLFRHAPGVCNSASRVAPGVDVRGEGGFVIMPPSVGYSVIGDAVVAHWPDWLMPLVLPPPRPPGQAPCAGAVPVSSRRLDGILRAAPDGSKHFILRNTALLLGGIADSAGFTDDSAVQWLLDALPATVRDWRTAERTARWGLQQGRASPIELAEPAAHRPDPRRKATARAAFRLLRTGMASADVLAALHRQNRQRSDPLPAGAIDATALWAARRAAGHGHAK